MKKIAVALIIGIYIFISLPLLAQDFSLYKLRELRKKSLEEIQQTCIVLDFHFIEARDGVARWEKQRQENMQIIYQTLLFKNEEDPENNIIIYGSNQISVYNNVISAYKYYDYEKTGEEVGDNSIIQSYKSSLDATKLQVKTTHEKGNGTIYVITIQKEKKITIEPVKGSIEMTELLKYMGRDFTGVNNNVLFKDWIIDNRLPKSEKRSQQTYASDFGILTIFYNATSDLVDEIRLFCQDSTFAANTRYWMDANDFTYTITEEKNSNVLMYTKKFDNWFMRVEIFRFKKDGSIMYDLIESDH